MKTITSIVNLIVGLGVTIPTYAQAQDIHILEQDRRGVTFMAAPNSAKDIELLLSALGRNQNTEEGFTVTVKPALQIVGRYEFADNSSSLGAAMGIEMHMTYAQDNMVITGGVTTTPLIYQGLSGVAVNTPRVLNANLNIMFKF